MTIQNSIIAYGLRFSTDADTVANPGQHHSMGVIIGDGANRLSILSSALVFNLNRNPRIQSGLNEVCGNVVYGAQANPITISGGQVNVVGNSFDRRPQRNWSTVIATSGTGRAHASANTFPGGGTIGQAAQATPYATPSCTGKKPVALSAVGARPRNSLDALTVQHMTNITGTLIDSPSEVGGWPTLADGTPYADNDADGMSDAWESSHGFNPGNAADRNADPDGNGFTALDDWLAQRANDVSAL